MYKAKEKPSDSSAVAKEKQMASQSLSQGFRPERPHCVSADWEQMLRRK